MGVLQACPPAGRPRSTRATSWPGCDSGDQPPRGPRRPMSRKRGAATPEGTRTATAEHQGPSWCHPAQDPVSRLHFLSLSQKRRHGPQGRSDPQPGPLPCPLWGRMALESSPGGRGALRPCLGGQHSHLRSRSGLRRHRAAASASEGAGGTARGAPSLDTWVTVTSRDTALAPAGVTGRKTGPRSFPSLFLVPLPCSGSDDPPVMGRLAAVTGTMPEMRDVERGSPQGPASRQNRSRQPPARASGILFHH